MTYPASVMMAVASSKSSATVLACAKKVTLKALKDDFAVVQDMEEMKLKNCKLSALSETLPNVTL